MLGNEVLETCSLLDKFWNIRGTCQAQSQKNCEQFQVFICDVHHWAVKHARQQSKKSCEGFHVFICDALLDSEACQPQSQKSCEGFHVFICDALLDSEACQVQSQKSYE
ncbi:hypothetical protein BaRGS_00035118 [Batillaria attramentaria]|uniref:Uncharacterized protein n=1 Tax=Batillaria attramentaria TaxID=370345 RepID=A0ABD0JFI4_9CAEN